MEQITVRIPEHTLEELDHEAEAEGGVASRSEYIRQIIDQRNDDEKAAELERLRTQVERLQNEKQLILQEREEKSELVAYVEEERSAEQRWRQAGLGTKLKWRVFGMPEDADK